MRIALVLVAVVACSKKEPAKATTAIGSAAEVPSSAAAAAAPDRFVAIADKTARIIEVDATGAKVITTAQLPQHPAKVVWAGKDPVVLFATERNVPDTTDDPKLDGRLGTITSAGFTWLPALPAATWVVARPKGATNLGAYWDLEAASTGETWQGHCEWGGIEDGGHCDEWVWARVGGAFPLSSRSSPPEAADFQWTPAAPAAGYAVTFTPQEDNEYHSTITCKGGGATLTLPNAEHEEPWDKESGVRWVSTDPPVFVADQIIEGFTGSLHTVVFEGCAWSKLNDATLFAGPDNVLVIANGQTMSVRRAGTQIASLPGADLLAFAPRDPATTSAFAILERELAGDTSMLSPDAMVLAPAPTPARGIHLVPGALTNARLIAYHADSAGDASWLAAEIEITTDGPPHTVRTTQLIDPSGHVIVASFAPLKPLSRAATAPAIPQPTDAGPLAALLTAPGSAAAVLDEYAVVFGTDPDERAADGSESKKLLGSWSKLALQPDPGVREVRTAKYGYALANVSLAKPGGDPYRMTALVIGYLADAKWKVAALHYLAQ